MYGLLIYTINVELDYENFVKFNKVYYWPYGIRCLNYSYLL